ncbi:unnamed protein product [Candida verbasci]|uniref:PH-like domain-containing protein n=1 Tax=Candida verbasci TaxID=1227364 RepID=A0A9W4XE34_9ASCO|nr:unnamed protein product [Candida verbasci]
MTVGVDINPKKLLQQFYESSIIENENLIELLGIVKPLKSKNSDSQSFTSIVRGLYTKNTKLLSIINSSLKEIDGNEIQVFKNFINDFLLWLDSNGLILFEKYSHQLNLQSDINEKLINPINNINNIISFINSCSQFIRNPFIVEKLKTNEDELQSIINEFRLNSDSKKLNNIHFTNIKSFGNLNKESVSSYFTIEQIKERTSNSNLYMDDKPIELVLLDLIGIGKYNALAILSIDLHDNTEVSRTLIYPPFRINELSMSHTSSTIELKAINFAESNHEENLLIEFQDGLLLESWVSKLSTICPLARNNSPISSDKFLLSCPNQNMSGLGINVITDSDHKKFMSSEETLILSKKQEQFKELISPPSSPIKRSNSSIHSQYDKSLPLIKKSLGEDSDDDDDKLFHIINRRKLSEDDVKNNERPISIRAEIEELTPDSININNDPINIQELPYNKNIFANSMPNLTNKSSFYELSTGSAVDINNFGSNYKPSFTLLDNDSTTTLSAPHKSKPRRKSIFSIFKKSNKSTDTLNVVPESESKKEERPQLSRFSSSLPGPFALPSPTSTTFFKKEDTPIDIELNIPQDLKGCINQDSTEDFYISESSPKSLKISKWKQNQGNYEMLSISEKLFIKIALNREMAKCWFIVFEEEVINDEEIDKPVLLLNLNSQTEIRQSALDLQINTTDAINNKKTLIMIRCSNGNLSNEILTNLQDSINELPTSLKSSKLLTSDNTIASSMMGYSKSSTFTSLSSIDFNSRNDEELHNSCILNNPNSTIKNEIQQTIRLQTNLDGQIHNPSSWKILSMFNLQVNKIIDHLTLKSFYQFKMTNDEDEYNWLIPEETRFNTLEKIGKAGLLIKCNESEIYMIECKGKKDFKKLYDIFM